MLVEITSNIDDTDDAILGLIRKLDLVHRAGPDQGWKLQCRDCRYLGPWAAALLASAYLRGEQLGQRPRIVLPTEPRELDAFCLFSGLKHLKDPNSEPPDPEHKDCETVPIMQFKQAQWGQSDGVIRLLRRHTELGTSTEESLRLCIYEIAQNVVDHAESPVGGILCARFISARKRVRVAVVDRGRGIRDTLRAAYPDIRDSIDALSRVIQGGHSSRARDNNMGLGISNLWQSVEDLGGRIAIVSGDAWARIIPRRDPRRIETIDCVFPGTGVFFSLPTDPNE